MKPYDQITKEIFELAKELSIPEEIAAIIKTITPSEASLEDNSDTECEEEVCNVEDVTIRPFEDCPMAVVSCEVEAKNLPKAVAIKLLIDSGSAIDIISGKLARKLKLNGVQVSTANTVHIKVANGNKNVINQAMLLHLNFEGVQSDARTFMILEDLPFDALLGSRTCRDWDASLCWKRTVFEAKPHRDLDKRICVEWDVFEGQHWRKPASVIINETITIPPESQIQASIVRNERREEREKDITDTETGLITPIRSAKVLSQKFAVAYMFGEKMDKVVLMNTTNQPVTIARGTEISELHRRTREDFGLHTQYNTGCKDTVESDCRENMTEDLCASSNTASSNPATPTHSPTPESIQRRK